MKKTSNLYRLDPFLYENGMLQVGDHLKYADVSTAVKYPAIPSKKGDTTDEIIFHCHDSVEYQGHGMTHNRIRSSDASSAVSDHIARCVSCQKSRV